MSATAPGLARLVVRLYTDWPTDDLAADEHADSLSSAVEAAIEGLGPALVISGSVSVEDMDGGEAERDRLREALERIIDTHGGYPDDYAQIAREALGLESGPQEASE